MTGFSNTAVPYRKDYHMKCIHCKKEVRPSDNGTLRFDIAENPDTPSRQVLVICGDCAETDAEAAVTTLLMSADIDFSQMTIDTVE